MSKITSPYPCVAALLLIAATAAQAQQASGTVNPLNEIVVTSSRTPLPLRRIGTSISILGAEDIAARGNLALGDVLRQTLAISLSSNGGIGKPASLRVRGEEGYRTLTLVDGIRISDPGSPQVGPLLEHLLSSGVDRIEILRGPQGFSYGADAGGVVNVFTRRYDPGLSTSLDVQTGSFDTQQYSGTVGGKTGNADFSLAAANLSTAGFNAWTTDSELQDADGYDNTTLHLRAGLAVSDTVRVDLTHRRVSGESGFDGCYTAAFSLVHDCTSTHDQQASRIAVEHQYGSFTHSLAYATTRSFSDSKVQDISTFTAEGKLERVEYAGSLRDLPGFSLVFGADLEQAFNNQSGRKNKGIWLESLSEFSDKVFLTAGLRHDGNDDSGSVTSYRFSGAYLISLANEATLKLKSSYGTGFRAPSPYEIAYNAGAFAFPPAATISLTQETSAGYEAGVEFLAGNRLHLEAVYFNQDIDDAIYFDLDTFSGYLQDTGKGSSSGVELSGRYAISDKWRLNANYTHNDTHRPNGEPRLRRPENIANVGVTWSGIERRLEVNAFYRLVRDSIDQDGEQTVPLDDFALLDVSASYALNDTMQLYARIENLTDESYQEVRHYNTAGRAAYVGLKLQFTSR